MLNSISVDVEEYFHATNIEKVILPRMWHTIPSRVSSSTSTILDVFDEFNIKGTFFILGCVARRHPKLVYKISEAGHEVASHGYNHRLAYNQNKNAFRRDVYRSKAILEDITGKQILGYRAPNFSITKKNPWGHDILIENGYLYDSSIYPTYHPRYSNPEQPRNAFLLKRPNGNIAVFPLAVTNLSFSKLSLNLPVAGGAYWRLLPLWYIKWGLKRINKTDNTPFNCYFHPWELDTLQPKVSLLPFTTKIRHYGGISSFRNRLELILSSFDFGPIYKVGESLFSEHFSA